MVAVHPPWSITKQQLQHHCAGWGCPGARAHSPVPRCRRETSAALSGPTLALRKGAAGRIRLQGVTLKRPPCSDEAPKSLEDEWKASGRGLADGIKGSAALEMDLTML